MPSSRIHPVRLTATAKAHPTSRVRAQFNKLVKQLDAERKRLAGWHDAMPKMHARAEQELAPLAKVYDRRQRELVFLLDSAYDHKDIKKKEREKLSDVIVGLAIGLLDGSEYADDELTAMVEKHGISESNLYDDPDFIEFKKMIEQAIGVEDDDSLADANGEQTQTAPPEHEQQGSGAPRARGKAGERQAV